eukprot:10350372-Alexandrium_andersonii.AAC.1
MKNVKQGRARHPGVASRRGGERDSGRGEAHGPQGLTDGRAPDKKVLGAELAKAAQRTRVPVAPNARAEVEVTSANGVLKGRQARQTVEVVASAPGSEGVAGTPLGSSGRKTTIAPCPAGVASGGGGQAGGDVLTPARAAGARARRPLGRAP